MMRHILLFFLFLPLFFGLGKLSEKRTHGFAVHKIKENFPSERISTHPLTPEASKALNQHFYYYKRGAQSFAFLSEDGLYVLKVFNNKLKRKGMWLKHSDLKEKWEKTFESYRIASDLLAEETGLLYAHLNPLPLPTGTITLIDALGIAHLLSPQTTGFLIQKKGSLIYPRIHQLLKEGKTEEAKKIIDHLIEMIGRCHEKGVANHDPSVRKNIGLSETGCQTLDVGRFVVDETLKDPERSQNEKTRALRRFRKWLARKHPALFEHLKSRGY